MSKSIKEMMMRDYTSRLEGASDAMLISIRGVKAIPTSKLRRGHHHAAARRGLDAVRVLHVLAELDRVLQGKSRELVAEFLDACHECLSFVLRRDDPVVPST